MEGLLEYPSPLREVLGDSRRYAMVRDAVSGVIQCGKLSVMALASFSPSEVQEALLQGSEPR
ncbi:MAG: hypothetical protein ABIN54_10405 [candidate division WOR-3 bacterium]